MKSQSLCNQGSDICMARFVSVHATPKCLLYLTAQPPVAHISELCKECHTASLDRQCTTFFILIRDLTWTWDLLIQLESTCKSRIYILLCNTHSKKMFHTCTCVLASQPGSSISRLKCTQSQRDCGPVCEIWMVPHHHLGNGSWCGVLAWSIECVHTNSVHTNLHLTFTWTGISSISHQQLRKLPATK